MSAAEGATDGTLSGALELLTGSVRDLQSELEKELSTEGHLELPRAGPDAGLRGCAGDAAGVGRRRDERAKAQGDGGRVRRHQVVGQGPRRVPRGRRRRALPRLPEHFRHVNPADVANLVPQGPTKLEDDLDFRIPALGRYYVLGASPRARAPRRQPPRFQIAEAELSLPLHPRIRPPPTKPPPRTFHLRRVGGRGRPGS